MRDFWEKMRYLWEKDERETETDGRTRDTRSRARLKIPRVYNSTNLNISVNNYEMPRIPHASHRDYFP